MLELRRLLKQQIRSKATTFQAAELEEKRAILHRRITKWHEIQLFYMPEVRGRQEAREGEVLHPESIPLHLPSGVPAGCGLSEDLVNVEKRLRVAQADDALVELRRLLRVTMGLWDYKFSQLGPSQRANTRARSMISRFQDKVQRCAERYRVARSALRRLDPTGPWLERFLELKPEHVKAPQRSEDDESEGRRELSWIWMVKANSQDVNMGASEEEIGDSKQKPFL
jgi:hypothetical protein